MLLEPQKGILLGRVKRSQWTSNGGHDVPFCSSHDMYNVIIHPVNIICNLPWPLKLRIVMFWFFFSSIFSNLTSEVDILLES